jgi:hypothetical protein
VLKEEVMMKRMMLILGLFAGVFMAIPAQEINENSKKTREERRQERQEKQKIQFELTKKILENKAFVLEANTLHNRFGSSIPVSSMLNFIEVDSSRAVIQTGNPHRIGFNGLGGITAEGRLTDYELIINEKKKTFRVNLSVSTIIGMYDVQMYIGSSGNASATLYGLRGRSITYRGDIVPTVSSVIYEGVSRF